MIHHKFTGILPNWMARYQDEWITFKLNSDLPKWMDHSWMVHWELNWELCSRSLGLTEILWSSQEKWRPELLVMQAEKMIMEAKPQQILRSCAESLLTAVAQLESGERSLTDPAQTPVAGSSLPSTSYTVIEEHRRLFPYQMPSSSRCGRWSGSQHGQGASRKIW